MKAKDRVPVWDKEKENSAGESKEKQRTKTQLSKNKSLDKKSVRRVITNEKSTWRKQNAGKKEKGGLAGRADWRVVVHPLYFLWEEQRNWPQDYRLELITPSPLTVKPINFPPTPNYPLKAPQTHPPLSHSPVWTTCTCKIGAHEGEEGVPSDGRFSHEPGSRTHCKFTPCLSFASDAESRALPWEY